MVGCVAGNVAGIPRVSKPQWNQWYLAQGSNPCLSATTLGM